MPHGTEYLNESADRAIAASKRQAGSIPIPFGQAVRTTRARPELADKGAKQPPAGTIPPNDVTSRAAADGSVVRSVSYNKPGVYSIWGKSNL